MYPFQIHSIALSTFASLIGPFGGFFASGFKRAFKIKVGKPSVPLIVNQPGPPSPIFCLPPLSPPYQLQSLHNTRLLMCALTHAQNLGSLHKKILFLGKFNSWIFHLFVNILPLS